MYIYIYIHLYIRMCIYIYIYTEREMYIYSKRCIERESTCRDMNDVPSKSALLSVSSNSINDNYYGNLLH